MANNYSQCTVQPFFPVGIFTNLETSFLSRCGFTLEEYEGQIYVYAGECFDNTGNSAHDSDDFSEEESEIIQKWDVASVFQNAIKASKLAGGDITEVVIEAAFTCDKLRPGEFGGMLVRITEDCVQEAGTGCLLEWFRKNEGKQLQQHGEF